MSVHASMMIVICALVAVAYLLNARPPLTDPLALKPLALKPNMQVSLLVLNTVVPDDDQGEVAMALLDILNGGRESVALAASSATEENRAAGSTGAIAAASEAAAAGGCVSPTRLITVVAAMLLQQLAQPAGAHPVWCTLGTSGVRDNLSVCCCGSFQI